ncbi:hypothetical protein KOR34_21070 [Posidoniimonas corsicana]|uniref:Uncharacterized protein n=1 Tax=Posidoniimonas corsicana TaxID=1938618 RepID=A0A5C5VGT4_9BACT|nr:hypothetical protein [Posidoniimonas corsicana]TWT37160.1 hypothetical protein KOR34_21070 [Posidoniimonas corsicana]
MASQCDLRMGVLSAFLMTCIGASIAQSDAIDDLVAYRDELYESGTALVEVRDRLDENSIVFQHSVFFDKSRIRFDTRATSPLMDGWGPWDRKALTDQVFLHDPGQELLVERTSAESVNQPFLNQYMFDPRGIGTTLDGVYSLRARFPYRNIRDFLGIPKVELSPNDASKDGSVRHYEFGTKANGRLTITMDDRFDGQLTRVERTWRAAGLDKLSHAIIETSYQSVVGNNTTSWFPLKSHTVVRYGDKITQDMEIEVSRVSLGKTPPEAFTLEGFNLPEGTRVVDSTSGRATGMVWEGGTLRRMNSDDTGGRDASDALGRPGETPQRHKVLLVINILACVVLTLLAIMRAKMKFYR